jgi:MFS-type transporter involved in bile tolerance (Atg22 family)
VVLLARPLVVHAKQLDYGLSIIGAIHPPAHPARVGQRWMCRGPPLGYEPAEVALPTTMRTEIAEGLSWIRRHRLLRALVFTRGVMNLTFGAVFAVWVLYAQERLGLGPVGYGALAASIPVGGVLGGLVAEPVAGLLGAGTTLRAGLLIEVVTHLVLASTTSARTAGAVLALFGFHAIVWGTASASLRQELVPENLMGRINSVYLLFDAGSASIGALLGGLIASGFGLTAPFSLAAASVVA